MVDPSPPMVASVLHLASDANDSKAFVYACGEGGKPMRSAHKYDPVDITIFDIHQAGGPDLSRKILDKNGFEAVLSPTELSRDVLLDRTPGSYYAEVVEAVKRATGCKHAVAIRRRQDTLPSGLPVHVDYNQRQTGKELEDALTAEEYAAYAGGRYAIIDTVRSLADGPSQLAFLDSTSTSSADTIALDVLFPRSTTELYALSSDRASDHRWYRWVDLSPDMLLLFKQYESSCRTGMAQRTFAARLPSADSSLQPSVEVRVIALWKPLSKGTPWPSSIKTAPVEKFPLSFSQRSMPTWHFMSESMIGVLHELGGQMCGMCGGRPEKERPEPARDRGSSRDCLDFGMICSDATRSCSPDCLPIAHKQFGRECPPKPSSTIPKASFDLQWPASK